METKFPLGRIVMTRTAAAELDPRDLNSALRRHSEGDWGDVCDQDRAENDYAVERDLRLMSIYRDRCLTKFWIITEADRSVTTILLPEDY